MARTSPALRLALVVALALAAGGQAVAAPTLAQKRAEVQRLQTRLSFLDQQAGTAAVAYNRALDRLDSARSRLARTQADLKQSTRDLVVLRRDMAKRIVGLYKRGEPTMAEVLLSARSLARARAAADVLEQVSRSDARLVSQVRDRKARLVTLRRARARERAEAARQSERAAARRRQVEALVSQQRTVLNNARSDLKKLIAAEKERLARLAAAKAAAASQRQTGLPYRGTAASISLPGGVSHVFPIAAPSRFSDDFLFSRPGGRYHEGIDLFASYGAPVIAVADGTLFRVGYNGLGGWRLWLRDGAGTTFYYAHLSAFAPAAKEGARVSRGTVIGYVGTSGDARGTSPHVHFEIHPGGGGPTRPYPIVSSWPRA